MNKKDLLRKALVLGSLVIVFVTLTIILIPIGKEKQTKSQTCIEAIRRWGYDYTSFQFKPPHHCLIIDTNGNEVRLKVSPQ